MVQRFAHVLKQSCSVPQVFGEGVDSVKKSLEGIFDDTVPDGKVNAAALVLGCKREHGATGRGGERRGKEWRREERRGKEKRRGDPLCVVGQSELIAHGQAFTALGIMSTERGARPRGVLVLHTREVPSHRKTRLHWFWEVAYYGDHMGFS